MCSLPLMESSFPLSQLASAATLVNIRNATSCPHPPPKNGVTNIVTLGMRVLFKRTPAFLLLMHATIHAPQLLILVHTAYTYKYSFDEMI